jgi:hypothetical protein
MTEFKITHPEMVSQLAKSGEAILASLTPFNCHLLHMAMGVAGEAGELVELGELPEVDIFKVTREAGDVEFYLEGIRQAIGVPYIPQAAFASPPIVNSLTGIVIQATAILDLVKKIVIYEKPLDEENLPKLLGLVQHLDGYLLLHYNDHGITREQALADNIVKLGDRYKGLTYSNEQANDRVDVKEESLPPE